MSDLDYPNAAIGYGAECTITPQWATEVVQYESGYAQRNNIRDAVLMRFSLQYRLLLEVVGYRFEYQELYNFWLRHRGVFEAFWFSPELMDPLDRNPVGRDFGIGDGTTLIFKLPHDRMDACVVQVDGVPDAAAVPNLATGYVTFPAAPAADTRLTYTATNTSYRVRFGNDALPSTRFKFMAWGAAVELVQVRVE